MADATSTSTPSDNNKAVAESSCFQRTVCLHDWWLVKAENDFQGKWLAVAGTSSESTYSPFMKGAMRVFVSAPVVKRYDVFSLETADGIYVFIKGFINEQRTLENGFPPEVFNRFLFGFPSNWESYGKDCFKEEWTTGIDLGSAVPDNALAIDPEIFSDGVENSIPTSLVSPEEASGDHERPIPEDECNASKDMDRVNVIYGSCGNSCSTKLLNSEVCERKQQPASRCPQKQTDEGKNSSSEAYENPDGERLKSPVTPIESQSQQQVNTSSEQLIKKSATRILSVSSEDPLGDHNNPEDECNVSKEMGGLNEADGKGGNRRNTRLRNTRLRNIKVCKQKPASRAPPKHPAKEQSRTSGALENPVGEGLESPVTPIELQSQSQGQVNSLSEQLIEKSASRIPLVSPEEALGDHKKLFPDDESNALKEIGEINVADGNGGHRCSTRLHNIKICQQKKPVSGGPQKHPDKEQSSTLGALENAGREGLQSPVTPIQSQSQQGQVNSSFEQLIKKSASRISRPLFANTEGHYKRENATAETKATRPKRKMAESACEAKYLRERDGSPMIKGGEQKISSVSAKSLSFRKSRSGRLLLPPLEFWRNQIPIYNVDREITEIQEGASLGSPFSPSHNRSKKKRKPEGQ